MSHTTCLARSRGIRSIRRLPRTWSHPNSTPRNGLLQLPSHSARSMCQNVARHIRQMRKFLPFPCLFEVGSNAESRAPIQVSSSVVAIPQRCRHGNNPLIRIVGKRHKHVHSSRLILGNRRGAANPCNEESKERGKSRPNRELPWSKVLLHGSSLSDTRQLVSAFRRARAQTSTFYRRIALATACSALSVVKFLHPLAPLQDFPRPRSVRRSHDSILLHQIDQVCRAAVSNAQAPLQG